MKMSALMAEKCNSLSHFVDIVYNCFLIMYCIVSYCILCLYLICYLYTNVSTKVTRHKDIYNVTKVVTVTKNRKFSNWPNLSDFKPQFARWSPLLKIENSQIGQICPISSHNLLKL